MSGKLKAGTGDGPRFDSNPRTTEINCGGACLQSQHLGVEDRRSEVQGHLLFHSEFEVSPVYMSLSESQKGMGIKLSGRTLA